MNIKTLETDIKKQMQTRQAIQTQNRELQKKIRTLERSIPPLEEKIKELQDLAMALDEKDPTLTKYEKRLKKIGTELETSKNQIKDNNQQSRFIDKYVTRNREMINYLKFHDLEKKLNKNIMAGLENPLSEKEVKESKKIKKEYDNIKIQGLRCFNIISNAVLDNKNYLGHIKD